jgi:uncharacterized protein YlxW (UPF0749 family)
VLVAEYAKTEHNRAQLLQRMAELQAELDKLTADKAALENAYVKVAGAPMPTRRAP